MTWIIIEGTEKVGKSTVAKYYESKGFQVVHFSAPPKKYYANGYVGPSYLDDLIEQLMPLMGKDILFDRSWYGEQVWPKVFNREPLLDEEAFEVLSEIEAQNNTRRIVLHDPDVESHWERCRSHNEPVNRYQFDLSRKLFEDLAKQKAFELFTYRELIREEGSDTLPISPVQGDGDNARKNTSGPTHSIVSAPAPEDGVPNGRNNNMEMTPEQRRLAEANAINDVLSKPIVKQKGEHFQAIEAKIRLFLNEELSILLGTNIKTDPSLTKEEVLFIKTLIAKAGAKK